jgi:hypothetical protein
MPRKNTKVRVCNDRIALRAYLRRRDVVCRQVGYPSCDQGGGSGRIGSRRHVGDRLVGYGS